MQGSSLFVAACALVAGRTSANSCEPWLGNHSDFSGYGLLHQGAYVQEGIPSEGSVSPPHFEEKTMNYSSVAAWVAGAQL